MDPYALLGVARDADDTTIKKAYRKLARQYHPDVNPDPAAQEKFKEISVAYEVLSDPEKRKIFDLGGDPFRGNAAGFGAGAGFSFTDIMDAFFGGQQTGSRGPRSRTRRGQDALARVNISLAEAAFGTTKEIKIDTAVLCGNCAGSGAAAGVTPVACTTCHGRGEVQQVQRSFLGEVRTVRPCAACRGFGEIIPEPCRDCAGEGRVRSRTGVEVKIPSGVDNGIRVQLPEAGEVGPGGGPQGDLYVEIQVNEHPTFIRNGDDLHCRVVLPMTAAALGTELKIPLLEAEVADLAANAETEVIIQPGTQSGQEINLKGLGVPSLRSGMRGNLILNVVVETPQKLDDAQVELLKNLAQLRKESTSELKLQPTNKSVFDRLKDAFR